MKIEISDKLRTLLEQIKSVNVLELLDKLEGGYNHSFPINYLSVSETNPLYLSYLPSSRVLSESFESEPNYWNASRRVHARPSSVINKLVKFEKDKQVQEFMTEITQLLCGDCDMPDTEFKIVTGDDIQKYYSMDNYAKEESDWSESSLWQSCMRGDDCESFFGIYTDNPTKVALAILLNSDGDIKARCICWYPNGVSSDVKWFDRIYSDCYESESMLAGKLVSAGYKLISSRNSVKPTDEEGPLEIVLENNKFDSYPYVDTLLYYIPSKNVLCNYLAWKDNHRLEKYYELNSTDGMAESMECCEICDQESLESSFVQIVAGEHEGDSVCHGCASHSNVHGGYIVDRESTYLNYYGCRVIEADLVETLSGQRLEQHCIERSDGTWVYKEEAVVPIGSDEVYHQDSDEIIKIDGIYRLKETANV